MISDYHVHTYFSSDCEVSPREHISKAIACGMSEICFTDHMDYDYPWRTARKCSGLTLTHILTNCARLRKNSAIKSTSK